MGDFVYEQGQRRSTTPFMRPIVYAEPSDVGKCLEILGSPATAEATAYDGVKRETVKSFDLDVSILTVAIPGASGWDMSQSNTATRFRTLARQCDPQAFDVEHDFQADRLTQHG